MPDRIIDTTPEVCFCGNTIDATDGYPGVCPKCGKIS